MVLRDEELEIRAVPLDHGIPVLAFALAEPTRLSVRADRVEALGLTPGPWLGELKRRVLAAEPSCELTLPDGRRATVAELSGELLFACPGQRIVYATDVGDTTANRDTLVELARGAQLLILEAAFASAHADRARATGHLTARACGEIATAARVERLLPFHLSSRYQGCPETVLAEVASACDRLWLPAPWGARLQPPA
jgi:ribonuclease BN (tRNA processing enzyme)